MSCFLAARCVSQNGSLQRCSVADDMGPPHPKIPGTPKRHSLPPVPSGPALALGPAWWSARAGLMKSGCNGRPELVCMCVNRIWLLQTLRLVGCERERPSRFALGALVAARELRLLMSFSKLPRAALVSGPSSER